MEVAKLSGFSLGLPTRWSLKAILAGYEAGPLGITTFTVALRHCQKIEPNLLCLLCFLLIAFAFFSFSACTLINSNHVFGDLKFRPLCSEIATVKVVIPSGPAPFPANIAFSDHLVAIPSVKALNLATFIGFSDLDPYDGGWSQNPM